MAAFGNACCELCVFAVEIDRTPDTSKYACHRHPPVRGDEFDVNNSVAVGRPIVLPGDFCGEFQFNELGDVTEASPNASETTP